MLYLCGRLFPLSPVLPFGKAAGHFGCGGSPWSPPRQSPEGFSVQSMPVQSGAQAP